MSQSIDARILTAVRAIPRGRVSTYGWIATLAGFPRQPRMVGYALRRADEVDLPWHRVVNAQGGISPRANAEWVRVQRQRLEQEGIRFDARGRIDLARFGWKGPSPRP